MYGAHVTDEDTEGSIHQANRTVMYGTLHQCSCPGTDLKEQRYKFQEYARDPLVTITQGHCALGQAMLPPLCQPKTCFCAQPRLCLQEAWDEKETVGCILSVATELENMR